MLQTGTAGVFSAVPRRNVIRRGFMCAKRRLHTGAQNHLKEVLIRLRAQERNSFLPNNLRTRPKSHQTVPSVLLSFLAWKPRQICMRSYSFLILFLKSRALNSNYGCHKKSIPHQLTFSELLLNRLQSLCPKTNDNFCDQT